MLVTDEILKKSEESTAVCSRIAIMIIQQKHTNGQKTKTEKKNTQKNTGPEIQKKISLREGFCK